MSRQSQIHKQVVRKEIDQRDITLKPIIKVLYIEVKLPSMEEPLGDSERIISALKEQWKLEKVYLKFNLLGQIQKLLRDSDWKISCVLKFDYKSESYEVIDVYSGLF